MSLWFVFQKVKLIGFEEHFSEKVEEIDDKYQQQIHELKQQNIELRFVLSLLRDYCLFRKVQFGAE